MKIEGTHQIDAPRTRVYEALIDPQILQRAIPGCESLQRTGENTYAATMRTGVGSIKGVFNGTVKLENLRAPEHFRMIVEGKGAPGFLKGSGDLDLQVQGNATSVNYTGEVQVGGTIASVGQRMLQGTVKMMAAQFFTALGVEARTEAGEPPPQHNFFRTALRWFSGWLKRWFSER
jgi:carbon monoxide dehydrogenase subunit G